MLDFLRLFMVAIILILIFLVFLVFKVNITYKNHMIIIDAIFKYRMNKLHSTEDIFNPDINYEDREPFEATLFRLWDFGYKNILPPEKFEKVRPFIF